MRKEFAFVHRKVRIWLDDLPPWEYQIAQMQERSIATKIRTSSRSRNVAVEIFRFGDSAFYAALGATFHSLASTSLVVKVCASEGQGLPIKGTLADQADTVSLGLPQEYVPAILEGATSCPNTPDIGPGIVSFCRALHGEVGSAPAIFRSASEILIRLLSQTSLNTSDEVIMRCLL